MFSISAYIVGINDKGVVYWDVVCHNSVSKLKLLFFILLISSCDKKEALFPSLEVDPLINMYSKNKIRGFVMNSKNSMDSLITVDSIRLNEDGQMINRLSIGNRRFESKIKYDTLRRIIEDFNGGGQNKMYYIDYKLNSSDKTVEQYWRTLSHNDTILAKTHIFKFDDSMTHLLKLIELNPANDNIVRTTEYTYSNNRINSILEKSNNYNFTITFVYNSDSLLTHKETKLNNYLYSIHYISTKTGLTDSVIESVGYKVYYKYY